MFHGPLFRGVRSIDGVGDNGARATLTVVPRENLIEGQSPSRLVTDFVLLDQPGQVVGFWAAQYLERGFVVLPFRLGALHLFGPPLPVGEQTTCRAQIELSGERGVRSQLDVVRSDGRLWASFEDWEDRRFDLPQDAFRALLQPLSSRLSRRWVLTNETSETNM